MSNYHEPSKLHRASEKLKQEIELRSGTSNWEDNLLKRIHARFPLTKGWIHQAGIRADQMQIQFVEPWEVLSEFEIPTNSTESGNPTITRIRFHVYHPITKEPGTVDIQLNGETGTLLLLIRSPKPEGGYEYFLGARRKFQPGARMAKIVEFSRGYIPGKEGGDIGWGLFKRDFPGLEGQSFVKSIWHTKLGNAVFENTGDRMNLHGCHLVLVTLAKPMSGDELQKLLTAAKIEEEYENRRNQYPDLSSLTDVDLKSAPVIMPLKEAAAAINAHSIQSPDAKEWIFGEDYSQMCWDRFIKLYRDQFPECLPKTSVLPE